MKIIINLFALLAFATICSAQEQQIAFDSAGKVFVISQQLEDKLHLFPEFPEFQEARLYQSPDSSYLLEVSYSENGKPLRSRLRKDQAWYADFQSRLDADIRTKAPSSLLDQSSRTKFLVIETILSTFVYGPMILAAADVDNGAAGAGIELLIGGSGFLVPYLLTQNASVTDGEASLALGGAFNGLGHGMFLSLAVQGEADDMLALTAGISIIETAVGYAVAHSNNLSEGSSDIIRYGGFFGMGQGTALSLLIDPEPSAELMGYTALATSGIGYYTGSLMAKNNYTRGDATVALTTGIYGAYSVMGLLIPALSDIDADAGVRISAAAALVGNVGGLLFANELAKNYNLSSENGTLVLVGTSVGWLVGSGIGFLLASTSDFESLSDSYLFTIPSVAGTIAGLAISYSVFGSRSGKDEGSNFDVMFNPGALMGALSPIKETSRTNRPYVPPALSIRYSW